MELSSNTKAIGGIIGGVSPGKSLVGESVFNFDDSRRTATQVPEPMTMTLRGMGLLS